MDCLLARYLMFVILLCIGIYVIVYRHRYIYAFPNDTTWQRLQYSTVSSMDRYTKFNICTGTVPPEPIYALPDDTTWQRIRYSNTDSAKTVFLYNSYLDSRNIHGFVVRSFIITEGYFHKKLYCYLWFSDLRYPLVVKAVIETIEISRYTVNGTHYSQYMVACSIGGSENSVPHHISISLIQCGSVSTYLPIIPPLPEKQRNNQSKTRSIGVCMASQYGETSDTESPFFIQWMEALLLFGVSQIHMYNSSMRDVGASKYYTQAIDYYVSIGKLSIKQMPYPYKTHDPPRGRIEYNAAEILRMVATNDCLYRNLFKYDYILHIDRDELIVPKSCDTYQEYLTTTLDNNYDSIGIPSAFFYRHFPPFNAHIPQYLPLNRLSYRTPVEAIVKGNPGFSKSFNNPKKCINMWSHRCTKGIGNRIIADKKEILVHHYRSSCRMGKRCTHEWERRKLDTTLHDKYGAILEERTLRILQILNYNTSV